MPEKTKIGAELHCHRCGRNWNQGRKNPPKTCRWCGSPDWTTTPTKAATVQRIPQLIKNPDPEDFYLGIRVKMGAKYGTILIPKKPNEKTKSVKLVVDFGDIMPVVRIDKLKIVQAVDRND